MRSMQDKCDGGGDLSLGQDHDGSSFWHGLHLRLEPAMIEEIRRSGVRANGILSQSSVGRSLSSGQLMRADPRRG